ncbi:MAG: protein-disulfide reductase DsbD, partial [Gammaproteobacteria bacterium]|nr:protein-disulfide reductase DsbD [Gammaproteobacteria bacterium]
MNNKLPRLIMIPWKLLGILLVLLTAPAHALDRLDAVEPELLQPDQALNTLSTRLGLNTSADEFLDPNVAFQADIIEETPNLLLVRWTIARDYYLYRDKLNIQLVDSEGVTLGPIEIPTGKIKHDEFFGDVQVFYNEIEARIPLQRTSGEAVDITLQLGYQGCAEAGICYPLIKKQLPVSLAAFNPNTLTTSTVARADSNPVTTRQDDIVQVLQDSSLGWVALFFFGAGILLAFTACMYPLIPILCIIVGQGKTMTAGSAFLLALVYIEAVAVTYAVIGVITAQLGAGVQAFFQNPWILGFFALVFIALAMSMFGLFNIQLPASLQAKLTETSHRRKGGTFIGVAILGVLSAFIVGPCATPVLTGALIYTSQSGDYLTGALAMFALGNGLGAPLLVICTSGGKLLPKAGNWMNVVKAVFGVILLGVAILMLERILPGPVTLMLWALLLIVPAIYMRALDALPDGVSGWQRFWKGLGVAMLIYGAILILGAASGARDPLNPMSNINAGLAASGDAAHASQHLQFNHIKSIADFNTALQDSAVQGKPVMLDFYADWCTYCAKMEDYTFSAP